MKKSLLALSLTVVLFSCKKETTPAEFTPTDLTGTAYIKGNTTKNIVTPNGNGAWTSNSRVAAAGVNVTVRVLKSSLYPNSSAQGADVYSGTTDANGNYNIAIKANGNGVTANVIIDGFSATLDTVINGVSKAGLPCLYVGTNVSVNAFSGQTTVNNYQFTASNVGTNPNNIVIGSAIVSGSVSMNFVTSSVTIVSGTAGATSYNTTNTVVPAGTKVYLDFSNDPINLSNKLYTTTTDAAGGYTFNLPTVAAGTPGFNQNANIWVADYARTRDSVKITSVYTGTLFVSTTTVMATGKPGVYQGGVAGSSQQTQGGVYNNEIRNASNLNYLMFTPN